MAYYHSTDNAKSGNWCGCFLRKNVLLTNVMLKYWPFHMISNVNFCVGRQCWTSLESKAFTSFGATAFQWECKTNINLCVNIWTPWEDQQIICSLMGGSTFQILLEVFCSSEFIWNKQFNALLPGAAPQPSSPAHSDNIEKVKLPLEKIFLPSAGG